MTFDYKSILILPYEKIGLQNSRFHYQFISKKSMQAIFYNYQQKINIYLSSCKIDVSFRVLLIIDIILCLEIWSVALKCWTNLFNANVFFCRTWNLIQNCKWNLITFKPSHWRMFKSGLEIAFYWLFTHAFWSVEHNWKILN